jgi:hypothetical protein
MFDGIVALILPLCKLFNVPMFTAFAKLPLASLNCAVKVLPVVNSPAAENETLTGEGAQNEVTFTFVVIEAGMAVISIVGPSPP